MKWTINELAVVGALTWSEWLMFLLVAVVLFAVLKWTRR